MNEIETLGLYFYFISGINYRSTFLKSQVFKMQKFNYLVGFIFLNLIIISKATSNKKSKNKISDKLEKPVVNENEVGLPTEVAIIGSGIAGLAAARKLSSDRTNFTVKVYEARKDRFGGRVWTDKLKNTNAKGMVFIYY